MSTRVVGMQERIAGCEAQLQQLDEQVVSLKGEFESKKGLEIELKNSLARADGKHRSSLAVCLTIHVPNQHQKPFASDV